MRRILAFLQFIQRWKASKDCEIPEAFHHAFNRKLDQIKEHERIQQQWQEIWDTRKPDSPSY